MKNVDLTGCTSRNHKKNGKFTKKQIWNRWKSRICKQIWITKQKLSHTPCWTQVGCLRGKYVRQWEVSMFVNGFKPLNLGHHLPAAKICEENVRMSQLDAILAWGFPMAFCCSKYGRFTCWSYDRLFVKHGKAGKSPRFNWLLSRSFSMAVNPLPKSRLKSYREKKQKKQPVSFCLTLLASHSGNCDTSLLFWYLLEI